MEVWENEKCSGNTSRRRVFPQRFRVLPSGKNATGTVKVFKKIDNFKKRVVTPTFYSGLFAVRYSHSLFAIAIRYSGFLDTPKEKFKKEIKTPTVKTFKTALFVDV